MENWIWHGLHLTLPHHWELLQFSKNPEQGRLLFADPKNVRLEASWQTARKAPAWSRLVEDYRRLLTESGWQSGAYTVKGPWHLLETQGAGQRSWRVFRFFETSHRLLELVWYPSLSPSREKVDPVLDSCRWPLPPERSLHWRAYGMDVRLPKPAKLITCEVKPAHVIMAWEQGGGRLHCERRGFTARWLQGNVSETAAEALPEGTRIVSTEEVWEDNQPYYRLTGTHRRGRGVLGLLRRGQLAGKLWKCRKCERVLRWLVYPFPDTAENESELPKVCCTNPEPC